MEVGVLWYCEIQLTQPREICIIDSPGGFGFNPSVVLLFVPFNIAESSSEKNKKEF
jgi:hypothetical protein